MINTTLPLLEGFRERICRKLNLNLEQVILVCVQHLLETTVELFKTLLTLRIPPKNIFLIGKNYSQSTHAIQKLLNLGIYVHVGRIQTRPGTFSEIFERSIRDFWDHILCTIKDTQTKSIVILDDGGFCLVGAPPMIFDRYTVIGIEQTTAGTVHAGIESVACPIIQVALSAAKKELEPPIIATAVVQKIIQYCFTRKNFLKCGIIGAGAIGKAVGEKLISLGYYTTLYRKEKRIHPLTNWSGDIKEFIQYNDIILGCSGTDVFHHLELTEFFNGNKIFASCSSEDKEFLTLLKWLQRDNHFKFSDNPLQHLYHQTTSGHTIQVLRGGFPINFDNIEEVEPAKDIQLTRALLLGGIFQSLIYIQEHIGKRSIKYMLHPDIQRYIVLKWLMLVPKKNALEFIEKFSNSNWVITRSKGHYLFSPEISKIFSLENECSSVI